jgi:acylphosphatase
LKKIYIIITGTVTGVGFRWWLKTEAEKRMVYGFVKNRNQNEVGAVLLGNKKDVDNIINLCRKGPTSSKVENIKIEDYQQQYFKKSFDILSE